MAATAKDLREWLARFHDDTPVTAISLGGRRYPISGFAQAEPDDGQSGEHRWKYVAVLLGPPFTVKRDG